MRLSQRLIAATVLIALSGAVAGCSSSLGNWDPTDLLDFLDTKKKLPGERKPVFPDGVPGLEQGVPKDMYKGSTQEQIDQQNAATAAAVLPPADESKSKVGAKSKVRSKPATAAAPQEPAAAADPGAATEEEGGTAAAPPAPKPKKIVRKRTTAPPPDQQAAPQSQPAPAAAQAQPAPAAAPSQQSAAPPFPAPLPSGSFTR